MNYLYPNKENISTDQNLPIPIETVYFLEDGEQDITKPNRYYFNFPADWLTSNRGESIVGIRNINMLARRRKIEFDLSIRKYLRCVYNKLKKENPTKTKEEIISMMDEKYKGEITVHIISWLGTEHDFRKLFDDIKAQLRQRFDAYNKHVESEFKLAWDSALDVFRRHINIFKQYIFKNPLYANFWYVYDAYRLVFSSGEEYEKVKAEVLQFSEANKDKLTPRFHLEDVDRSINDVQMDGYYDYEKNTFVETLFSPLNTKLKAYIQSEPEPTPEPSPDPPPDPTCSPVEDEDDVFCSFYYTEFKIHFVNTNTDENYNKDDFTDLMNIGYKPHQNHPDNYKDKWLERLDFYNVWDRQPCKIFSSIAEQSAHNYIGDSSVNFIPIKYYKLNSNDQQFWIEFYSGRHNSIPIMIPKNESFVMEMQFLPYSKLLYI